MIQNRLIVVQIDHSEPSTWMGGAWVCTWTSTHAWVVQPDGEVIPLAAMVALGLLATFDAFQAAGEGLTQTEGQMTGELCVMDRNGDTKIIWDSGNPDEVENARASFDRLKKKGYLAYRVMKGGNKGEVMTEFDATAGKIIMAPAMVGG